MIEDLMKKQEDRRAKKAEKMKLKKAEEAVKQAAMMKEATKALNSSDQEVIKLEVTTTSAKLFAEDSPANIIV